MEVERNSKNAAMKNKKVFDVAVKVCEECGGFDAPHRTKTVCANPVFADHNLHRIAIMKKEHFGSPGDRDEGGIPGWVASRICTGCGKEFKNKGFYVD